MLLIWGFLIRSRFDVDGLGSLLPRDLIVAFRSRDFGVMVWKGKDGMVAWDGWKDGNLGL